MGARPKPTQLEHLSDASFLGKLLVFPANVRLDWKVITSTNSLAYLVSSPVTKEKSFMFLTPDGSFIESAAVPMHKAMSIGNINVTLTAHVLITLEETSAVLQVRLAA